MTMSTVPSSISVPLSLLLTKELLPTTKLVWLSLLIDSKLPAKERYSPTRLSTKLGLSRLTIRKAISTLQNYGWHARDTQTVLPKLAGSKVRVKVDLIFDNTISIQARLIQALLGVSHMLTDKMNQLRYSSLSQKLHLDIKTIKKSIRQLTSSGWLQIKQVNQLAPILFTVRNPISDKFHDMKVRMQRNIREAKFLGEALMREILSLIINSDNYIDNANPGFLENPESGRLMQIDRFYFPNVAFEFNGDQHDRATEMFSQDVVDRQRHRDQLKRQICAERGIHLVTVYAKDLSISTLLNMVGTLLPLRNLHGGNEVIDYLEMCCERYRAKAELTSQPT